MSEPVQIYCMDTSGWLDGWSRHYPPDVFPSLWTRLEELIANGSIKSSEEVYIEINAKDDSLHDWIKTRKKNLLIPLGAEVQAIASEILNQHPRLVDTLKGRSQADPFVIATAEHLGATVVTGERPSNSLARPRIPDVCNARGRARCISFLEMLKELGWRF